MSSKQSRLVGLGPVCCDNSRTKAHSRDPSPWLSSNIKQFWGILELVVQDWKDKAAPLQEEIDSLPNEVEKLIPVTKATSALDLHYLKCLFSYAVFFIALEGAYDKYYAELNALNRKPFLRVKHGKKPGPTAYVEKVRMIRNLSVAHVGSDKQGAANSMAGMSWGTSIASSPDGSWDLERMIFGSGTFRLRYETGEVIDQSDDFEIKGILEMDRLCGQYIDEYDRVCAEYLAAIHAKLPITVGDEHYSVFDGYPKGDADDG